MTHPRLLIVKFLQKTKLNKLAHKFYYNYFHGFNTAGPEGLLPTIKAVFQKAQELGILNKGDYYEFGIFKGYAFLHSQKTAMEYQLNHVRFFGFDSFKGLPKIQGRDFTKDEVFYEGQFACSKEKVVENLTSGGVDWQRTFLIDGFFENSLNEETKKKYNLGKAAIALIDCDLYSSTVEVLNFLEDMIMDQTILMFDDWNCFDRDDEKGQRKAFKEFLEKNKCWSAEELFSYGLYGQVFLMKLNHAP